MFNYCLVNWTSYLQKFQAEGGQHTIGLCQNIYINKNLSTCLSKKFTEGNPEDFLKLGQLSSISMNIYPNNQNMKFHHLVFIHVFVCMFFIHESSAVGCLYFSLMEKMCQALDCGLFVFFFYFSFFCTFQGKKREYYESVENQFSFQLLSCQL